MAAAAVDVGYLAASYDVPQSTLHSLLSEPTVELVQSLLVQIEAKAREFDDLQSEKLKVDVELDNAIQTGEQRARASKAAADKAREETDDLRQKLAEEATVRQQVESQLQSLQADTEESTTQRLSLESRIRDLESQNRDTVASYNTKVTAYDRLAQELSDQHQKYVELRKQLAESEEQNQTLQSAANNVKFRETNMQQEIEMLRKNNEWLDSELKTRTDDHSKFRKDKNAQLAQLQRANADAVDTIESLKQTESLLRKHVEELKSKADEDQTRIQQLEDDATQQLINFRNELDNAKRLTALHQKNHELAKNRLEELQAEYAGLQDSAATEIGQMQADLELERHNAQQSEARAANLENLIAEMEREAAQPKATPVPVTPRRANGAIGTPGRMRSPASFTPGVSNTMILKENSTLKEDIRKLRDEDERKTSMIAEMLEELQRAEPIMTELREENEVITGRIREMSNEVEAALNEKDAAKKDERRARGDLEGAKRECEQLRQNVQDLSTQLRSLMWRQQAQEQGMEVLTPEQRQFVIDSADNQMPSDHLYGETATDVLISQHLVLYKNITEAQTQNASLLRTIREVAQQYEGDEARSKIAQHAKDEEELKKLQSRVQEDEEQIKSLTARAQTYKKERDTYREIATRRGFVPQELEATPAFGQSFNSQIAMTPLRGGSASQIVPQTPQTNQIPGVDKLVRDLQSQVDVLKEESAADRTALKSQLDSLTKDNHQLQGEKVHLDSQLRREQDRCARLETSAKLYESEKNTLQERYHTLQATLAKQDDKAVKAEQEVSDAMARVRGLEAEITTLKTSQSMWKSIEARLTERNQELMDERDRLTKMISNMQNMQNEHEVTMTEKRRELQDKVTTLDDELQIVRRKLEEEVNEHKKTTQQRDYERLEAQRRIDDLIKAKNDAEVRSASADTARQQLEQRVNELQTLLQAAEERASSLRPRANQEANTESGDEDNGMTREEELTQQLSELQRKLKRTQEELDDAKVHMEGYKNIAQEAENALQESVDASTLYEEEMSRTLEEKDTTITNLQQRMEEISSELVKSSSELTELRGQQEQETLRLTQEKETLDAEIARLKDDVADYKAEAERQTEYVKSQADIAIRAHQDYEQELAKHGETMKNLRTLRDEYNSIKSQVANFKSEAEVARTALENNDEHWKSMQSRYESQVIEAKRTQDDLRATNKTLMKQFDDYKAQIDNLKSNRTTAASSETNGSGQGSQGSSNLEDLITYLRREKEIKEVEYNIKEQEAKRLETQLSLMQSQLDQAREKLYAAQANAESAASGTNLQALQSHIEQLNIFRESNMTLRNETARLEGKVAEKTKEVQELQEELEPLRSRVFVLEGELELSQGYHKQAETARDYWQERYNKFFTAKDRISPEEIEKLKQENLDLKQERDQAVERASGLEENMKTLEGDQTAAIEAAKEAQKEEFKQKFNKRHKQILDASVAQKNTEIETITAARDELQSTLTSVRQELAELQSRTDQFQQQASSAEQEASQYRSQIEALQQELQAAQAARDEALSRVNANPSATADVTMTEEGQIGETAAQPGQEQMEGLQKALDDTKKQLTEAQNRAYSAENDYSALQVKVSMLTEKITKLEQDDAEKSNRIVELQGELASAQQQAGQPTVTTASNDAASAELEKVKQELVDVQKALDEAKAEIAAAANKVATSQPATDEQSTDAGATTIADLEEREAKLKELEASLEQRESKVSHRESQSGRIRDQANNKIKEMREKFNTELATLQTEIDTLKQEKEASSESAKPAQQAQPKTEVTSALSVPAVDADDKEVRDFFHQNKTAQAILRSNVQTRTNVLSEQVKNLKAENESLKTQSSNDTAVKSEEKVQQSSQQDVEAALSKAKAEHEQHLKKALEKAEQMHAMKAKMKEGMLVNYKARSNFVEKAAKETPTEEVAKVWPGAVEAGNKAKEQHTAEEKRKAAEAAQKQAQASPSIGAAAQAGSSGNAPQANGAKAAAPAQLPRPAAAQQANPFIPTGQVNPPNTAPGAFGTPQFGRGNSGIAPPGSFGQPQNLAQQVPAQQQQQQSQQQQQQAGRGRGDGVGTGPGALRGIIGNQTQIPRGGSGIPQPGGRGRGQQGQQGQQQPSAIAIPNAQGASASQIGRGGRGGRGGGRGGNQGNPSSPRTSLNPGAAQFNPGASAGRGQKRGPEDEGEGGTRGGKRARGGRGGQGGGGGGGGGGE